MEPSSVAAQLACKIRQVPDPNADVIETLTRGETGRELRSWRVPVQLEVLLRSRIAQQDPDAAMVHGSTADLPQSECAREEPVRAFEIGDAFGHFFRRVKEGGRPGFPRFKREVTSLCYPDSNGSAAIVPGRNGTRRLRLSMIGEIPIKVHRAPPEGRVKTCTIQRDGDRWFAVLTLEVPDPSLPPATPPVSPIGVDLGLSHLATLSTGEVVEPPKFLRRAEDRLTRAQRVVSRRKRGSHNREKAKVRLARCHAKVRDQRRDFAHKLTTGWAKSHDLIAFEDMDLRSHMEGAFPKSTADAGWGMLRQMSQYKEARRSGRYVEVPTKNTTQSCSACGRLHDPPLTLPDRTYECPCGLVMDRDLNAARNVLARALRAVPGGTGESTPVEIGPPPHRKGRRVRSKKQEPPRGMGVAT